MTHVRLLKMALLLALLVSNEGGLLRKFKYARYNPYNRYVNVNSPCPRLFEYRTDGYGQLYGRVTVEAPGDDNVVLQIELSVGNRVTEGNEGSITLEYADKDQVGDALNYRVNFPPWQQIPPRLTKLSINDEQVCSGPKIPLNLVPVLTTVYLEHTLYQQPKNYEVDARKSGRSVFASKNPYNFNPATPQIKKPVIVYGNATATSRPDDFDVAKSPDQSERLGPKEDECGRTTTTNQLIMNGSGVPRGAYPWLAALFVARLGSLEYQCAASLITRRHAITAAHCVRAAEPKQILLFLGKLNIQEFIPTDGEQIVKAERYVTHPDYVENSANADLAIIVIAKELETTSYVRPVCLWDEGADLDAIVGRTGYVAGWGRDERQNKVTPEPRQVEMPIVSQEECLRSNVSFYDITSPNTFCAGSRNGSGPCNGDSGSGLVMMRRGRWRLRGVVSMSLSEPFKRTCDLKNYVVFTDATKYADWISRMTNSISTD